MYAKTTYEEALKYHPQAIEVLEEQRKKSHAKNAKADLKDFNFKYSFCIECGNSKCTFTETEIEFKQDHFNRMRFCLYANKSRAFFTAPLVIEYDSMPPQIADYLEKSWQSHYEMIEKHNHFKTLSKEEQEKILNDIKNELLKYGGFFHLSLNTIKK
jgi:hypothetical protein